MLNKQLKAYLQNLPLQTISDQALLVLLKLREEFGSLDSIDDEVISRLTKDKIIGRDYVNRNFKLLVPVYKDDNVVFEQVHEMIELATDRIDEYRTLFKGARVGNMGNKRNCIESMNRFILEIKASFDEILFATRYYIQYTDPQYIMNAENFIYKTTDKGEVSKLYDIIEELRLSKFESNML